MEAIEIRTATLGDAGAVAAYHRRCFENSYSSELLAGELEAPGLGEMRQQLQGWFRPESELTTLAAVVDDVPIGHFTVHGPRLVHLFVEPEHQGIGLGRRLLAQAEATMAADGYTDFELHTRIDNHAGITFYEAAGWSMTDDLIHTVEFGVSYDEHVLVKRRP